MWGGESLCLWRCDVEVWGVGLEVFRFGMWGWSSGLGCGVEGMEVWDVG